MTSLRADQFNQLLGIEFSAEQLAIITAPMTPGVVVAGAGTGKTTVMAARVVWLVGTGQVEPHQVLGLTFTRKAAQELASRVSGALENAGVAGETQGVGAEVISTYDAFAGSLVREFGMLLGMDSEPRMLTGASRFRLAERVVQEADGHLPRLNRLWHRSIPERILQLDSELQSHLVTPDDVREFSSRATRGLQQSPKRAGSYLKDVTSALETTQERLELLGLVEDYQRLKAEFGLVEYADQLRHAVTLAAEVPHVSRALRSRFRVVLLDEYQDTSTAQVKLLGALFSGPAGDGLGFPVTAVGDPNQAIYGWRGAAADNMRHFSRVFSQVDGSPAPEFTLRTNRRSGRSILEAGNLLAAELAEAGEGVHLLAPEGTGEGEVCAAGFDTEPEELQALVERALAEHHNSTPWSQLAVLVRTNATAAKVFQAFRERDVPVEIVGLGGLLHLPEVAFVVNMLTLLVDATHNPALIGVLTSSRWRIGLADLEALGHRAKELAGPEQEDDICLLEAAADPGTGGITLEARRRLAEFTSELDQLRRHLDEPLPDLLSRIISTTGLEAELLASGPERAAQLERLMDVAADYVDIDGDGTPAAFLAYLAAEDWHEQGLELAIPSQEDSVKLLTVHRAKGLEWDVVFVPSLQQDTFPGRSRDGMWPTKAQRLPFPLRGDAAAIPQLQSYDKAGMERYQDELKAEYRSSEDRLAYVAATRAKRCLVASWHAWTPGLKRQKKASPYLQTIAQLSGGHAEVVASPQNPNPQADAEVPWPLVTDDALRSATQDAATLINQASRLLAEGADEAQLSEWIWQSGVSSGSDARTVREWQDALELVQAEQLQRAATTVVLPEGLSATALMSLGKDPQAFAERLLRPMPVKVSGGAQTGSLFHEWLQRRFEPVSSLFEEWAPAPGGGPELQRLVKAFENGMFAHLDPIAVEAPFLLNWDGWVLRGRMDAVFRWESNGLDQLIVDWKTSPAPADPLQLAVYRQAWAQDRGVDIARVGAGFYHVLEDRLEIVAASPELIDRALRLAPGP